MKKEVYQGAIHTMVQIIDWTPINEKIRKATGRPIECRLGNGYIPDVTAIFNENYGKQTRSLILDQECCGSIAENTNMLISDLKEESFSVSLFKGIGFFRTHDDEMNKIMAMFPSFYFDIDEDDIKACLTGEEMPLYQFMESRYNYNGRVRSNERKTLGYIFHENPEIEIDVKDVLTKVRWDDKVTMEW